MDRGNGGTGPTGANELEIDPEALAREADAIAAEVPGPAPGSVPTGDQAAGTGAGPVRTGEPTMAELEAIAAANGAGLALLVDRLGAIVAPNWSITPDESQELAHASAIALAAWFPDGVIPIKYMVLLNLGGVAWTIAQKRRNPDGTLPPMKIRPAPAPANGTDAAA